MFTLLVSRGEAVLNSLTDTSGVSHAFLVKLKTSR